MISKEMAKALNEQITKEIYSAYLYHAMGAHSAYIGLKGFANWFSVQAQEELFHAQKIFGYVLDQGQKIELGALDKPESDYTSGLDMFEKTFAHEKTVTASINAIVDLAQKENDHATFSFLQWFVTEQVEEEANPSGIIDQLKLAGDGGGLFMIDKELAQRVYTPPAAAK